MKIQRKWLRDIASMIFTIHYLIAAEQADEKVRRVRGLLTVDHLRVSWNKGTSPYLGALTSLLRPRLTGYPPRALRIQRPAGSSYKEPIDAWLYFDGPLSALKNHTKMVLDMPGGGFVAMTPRHHEDKLLVWAGKTGLPVLSLDYRKAPEYPYPYSLNECYDAYRALITSRGRCIGLSGDTVPRIILTGDSAGANFAVGTTLMILQASSNDTHRWHNTSGSLPVPEGLILIYPALDMNIGSWMSDDQMALIQDQCMRKTNRPVMRKKSEDYYKLTKTPHPSDDEIFSSDDSPPTEPRAAPSPKDPSSAQTPTTGLAEPKTLRTRLAMSSMISYFNDRILTPEMMRAMIILYIGPHNRPDFATDYLLSPILAPESLLSKFPKTCFLTGERDPLVDDTVVFAGRLREAKGKEWVTRREMGLLGRGEVWDERDVVEVMLLKGISHGFLQFVSIFPEAWKHLDRCARWIEEIFEGNDPAPTPGPTPAPTSPVLISKPPSGETPNDKAAVARPLGDDRNGAVVKGIGGKEARHHRRKPTESSGEEDHPLMMSSSKDEDTRPRRPPRAGRRGRGRGSGGNEEGREGRDVGVGSETDLLARRMKGLAGSLMGSGEDGT